MPFTFRRKADRKRLWNCRTPTGPTPRRQRRLDVEALEDRLVPSTLYALDLSNQLLTFDSATPNDTSTPVTITGLLNNDNIVAIAFRPQTGVLYGLGTGSDRSGNVDLYTIDTNANFGQATLVGSAGNGVTLSYNNDIALDFDPVRDQARVVTDLGQNLRLGPGTGALVQQDTQLAYADGTSGSPSIGSIAYTDHYDGATATALYALDFGKETVVQVGDPSQTPPVSTDSGKLFTVGRAGNALEFNFSEGFTIAADGTAYASLNTTDSGGNFVVHLYTIDLQTGLAIEVAATSGDARIGDGSTAPMSLAVAPEQVFQFSNPTYTVTEGTSTVQATITVDRLGGSSGAVSVHYQTSDGTAKAGTDYDTASGTLSWSDGDATAKTFTVSILSDTNNEVDSALNLALSQPSTGTALGSQSTAVLTIHEPPQLETVQLDSATYSFAEGSGTTQVQVLVDRTGGTTGTVDVPFQVTDGSAVAGRDYTVVSTSPLVFQPGVAQLAITIDILHDTSTGGDEAFTVALGIPTSPDGSAIPSAGPTSEAAVTILEPETFTISGPLWIMENGGTATFTVTRQGSTDGDATVRYSFGGTAVAGVDFGLLPGPLIIPAGQASATLPIPIIDSGQYDGNESLVVTLTGVSLGTGNAAGLGVPSSAATEIVESNSKPPPPPPPPPPLMGNVTSFVSVAMQSTPPGRHRQPNSQHLTLTNISGSMIEGPISLVLVGLNKHVKLVGRTGISTALGPFPYLDVLADGTLLPPEGGITFVLQFANPTHRPVHYVPILIAGPGGR
jgi:hypothetical protein